MKKTLILGVMLASLLGLTACSDSDDPVTIAVNALLNGAWLKCENDNLGSFSVLLTMNNGDITFVETRFSGNDCDINNLQMINPTVSFKYTLGGPHTLDGTVAGITEGTELSFTGFTNGDPDTFDAVAINNLTDLYFTDEDADPAKDASSASKRPTTLDPIPFIRQ